jgi:hypothetical protein
VVRLLLIAAAIGVVLAGVVGIVTSAALSNSGKSEPAHVTLYNYGAR